MKLAQIKEQLATPQFNLNRSEDANGVKNEEWFRHWDNEARMSVSIHRDTLAAIKEDREMDNLGLQKEVREGSKGEYTAYRIVAYAAAEETL